MEIVSKVGLLKIKNRMKKVLILSYFAPPCSLTPSNRISGWIENLNSFGYYPVVITRHWNKEISSPEDALRKTNSEISIQYHDTHEIHYLPYKAGFGEWIFHKLKGSKLQFLSKIVTLFQLIFENYSIKVIPHRNMYKHAFQVLKQSKEMRTLIISANPFNQFHFGYKLKKHFSDLKWIADYRDDWTTTELESFTGIKSIVHRLQQKSEKKWVGTASHITSVSTHYVEKISLFTGVSGSVILNGFSSLIPSNTPTKKVFSLVYNGSLYPTQNIEDFLEVFKQIVDETETEIHMHFPGIAYNKGQLHRITKTMLGYEKYYTATERISKQDVIQIQQQSDLLVMISHSGLKGIPSSKLYEYLSVQKPILLFPNDKDIIEETILKTNTGYITNDSNELKKTLLELIKKKNQHESIYHGIENTIQEYSTYNQTKQLSQLLDTIS